jgi:hypothetical protein
VARARVPATSTLPPCARERPSAHRQFGGALYRSRTRGPEKPVGDVVWGQVIKWNELGDLGDAPVVDMDAR